MERRKEKPQASWKDGVRVSMNERNLQENDWADRKGYKLGCNKKLLVAIKKWKNL